MKLHEYQAKGLISKYKVAIPQGKMVEDLSEVAAAASELPGDLKVVKAQIHAGGRGKGGGVKVCQSLKEVEESAKMILNNPLITPQTSNEGQLVRKLLIEQGLDIKKELYFSILVDRKLSQALIMASTEGGMDIEEVAQTKPELIIKEHINPLIGLAHYQAQAIAIGLCRDGSKDLLKNMIGTIKKLYQAFMAEQASLLEINPLIITSSDEVVALDCKIILDDNGLFRNPSNLELRDIHEEDPMEIRASQHDLSYIKLDGAIGCMVNGAGLAMATMDIIKFHGAEPANFLDVGGGATKEKVEEALNIICHDQNVRCIFINIFGGIVRCDMIAEGILGALENVEVTAPIVVRLQGNNSNLAHQMIESSKFADKLTMIDDLTQAAQKAVSLI